jgi:hypothetical protein
MQAPLLFLCIVGICYALRAKKQVLPLLTMLLYFVLLQTAFSVSGRYSYSMLPVLIAFAAYSLQMFRCKFLHATVDDLRWNERVVPNGRLDLISKVSSYQSIHV